VDHPFIATLTRSGPVGQALLAGLIGMSIFTWAIIVSKNGALRRAERSARAFLTRFRQSGVEWMSSDIRLGTPETPLEKICDAGLRELRLQRSVEGAGRPLSHAARDRIQSALETETVDQINEVEKGQMALAIGASAGPLLGLLGTVWGIMNAFLSIGLSGNAGIATVAPGVAEALITTVAGLAVAIPSVVVYNIHSRKIQVLTSLFDRFSNEFLTTIDLAGKRAERREETREHAPDSPSSVFARHRT
jgi:biopolymer transport protein ExbB/TolQ